MSSLVTQIAQIEENLGELYGSLSKDFEGESAKELVKFQKKCDLNAGSIIKIFRETVTEMTLETIEAPNLEQVLEPIKNYEKNDRLVGILNLIIKLYIDFSNRISHISPETSLYLKKISRERKKELNTIIKLLESQ